MRKHILVALSILFYFGFFQKAEAQLNLKDSVVSVFMMSPTYSILFPGGDMKEIYLLSHSVGAAATFKTRGNWFWTLEANYLFNDNVRNPDEVLSSISTAGGNVIGSDGLFANITLSERGFAFWLKAGKLFPVIGPNKNSGLLAAFGAGFLQHKTRIDVENNTVPQLMDNYKKGYDKLCNGPAVSQFVGYSHMSNNQAINFYVGLECIEGFTKARRAYDFNAMQRPSNKIRFDFLIGLKAGWNLPFFKKNNQKRYYYN